MIPSTYRERTRAVSAMVSPRPIWISSSRRMIESPPSSFMPTWKEIRVRVEGLRKIMASVLPRSGATVFPERRASKSSSTRSKRAWTSSALMSSRLTRCFTSCLSAAGGAF